MKIHFKYLIYCVIFHGNIIPGWTKDTGTGSEKDCLAVSIDILAKSLELVESTHVVFAFVPNNNGVKRANCIASRLFDEKYDINVPFMFWEIYGESPSKNSVMDHFERMSAYANVALIPLNLPRHALLEWMEFTKIEYRVFNWLWIGRENKELKRLEKDVAEEGLGCRFASLSPFDNGLCGQTKKPEFCERSSEKNVVMLKISEVPVLQCKTDRIVYALWSYVSGREETELVYKATPRSLISGRTILIGTITMAPFMVLEEDGRGDIFPKTGIDEGLIKAFAQYLHFGYKLRTPKNALWGKRTKNGSWNGLVGLIQRQEIDYGFTALSITPEKRDVIDYSIPNFFDSVTFLTRKPRKLSAVYALILPYTFEVWSYVFAVVSLSPLTIDVVFRLIPDSERGRPVWNWSTAALYMFGALTQHGSGSNLPEPHPIRIIIATFWLFSLVFFTGYAGTLVSFLNFPSSEEPVDTTSILLKNAESGSYKVGTIVDSQVLELLNGSDVKGIFKILKKELEDNKTKVLVANHEEGIELATREEFALISASSLMEATAAKMGMRRILFAKDRFYFFQYGLGFPKGSLFKNMINIPLYRLIEAGIMNKGWMDMVDMRKIQYGIRNRSLLSEEASERSEKSLSLIDIQGVFLVTSFALAACFFVFFTETIMGPRNRQKIQSRRILKEIITENKSVQCNMRLLKGKNIRVSHP